MAGFGPPRTAPLVKDARSKVVQNVSFQQKTTQVKLFTYYIGHKEENKVYFQLLQKVREQYRVFILLFRHLLSSNNTPTPTTTDERIYHD